MTTGALPEFRIPPTCSISILPLYLTGRLIFIMPPSSSTYIPASHSAVDYLTICCCLFKTPTRTQTNRTPTYQYWGKTAPNAGESWLASVSAAAAPASPDPRGPAEEVAAPLAGVASLGFVAELMAEKASSVGDQRCHWDQDGSVQPQSD